MSTKVYADAKVAVADDGFVFTKDGVGERGREVGGED